MTDALAIGRAILAAQPFSQLIGTEMLAYGQEGVELRLAVTDKVLQQHGFVHGGVVSYLADNAITFAAGFAMGGGVLTAETKINFLRPAVGDHLIARATSVGYGRTQGVARCEVFAVVDGEEKLCAAAQGTVLRGATSGKMVAASESAAA